MERDLNNTATATAATHLSIPPITAIPTSTIRWLLDRTVHAASHDIFRPNLNGVLLHAVDGYLTAVATDGCRMAIAKKIGAFPAPAIITLEGARALRRLPRNKTATIEIDNQGALIVSADGLTIVVQTQQDCSFPDYERVIPQKNDKKIVFQRKPLLDHLRSILPSGRENIPARMRVSGGKMSFIRNDKGGECTVDAIHDDNFEAFVDARFFLDASRAMTGNTVTMKVANPLDPLILDDENGIEIVMPMRAPAS